MHPRENKRSYLHVSVLPGRSSLPSLWFRAIYTRVWIQTLTHWRVPLQYLTCLEWLWRNQQFWVSVTPIFIHLIEIVNAITVVLKAWSPPNQQHQRHMESFSVQCLTLCDPTDCGMPGLPVHYQLPEFTQTYVHWVSDAIQPSHPLSSPSPPVPNPSLYSFNMHNCTHLPH